MTATIAKSLTVSNLACMNTHVMVRLQRPASAAVHCPLILSFGTEMSDHLRAAVVRLLIDGKLDGLMTRMGPDIVCICPRMSCMDR